ncbi:MULTISPECIES: hypothetical protein [Vibrio]|uniref:hypothetical protein n=1 Tax=Vibrio TaxID=662 RepID=UPI001A90CB87|nr:MULTISPECIES: hypothetical protein [Vibrio]ELA7385304.1 hypothetical protein [Vibrio alginolyticus]MBO0243255.1 hypothetical protein [Vibrio sp. Vb0592]MBS9910088.1 hypothetical protein [Vibrio alginolyticus]MBT0047661.1 hypothetical protein [Vibrio alginolyticus]MBT0061627.1 hypothetical protein [Vibrio alginolyticus]
MSLDNLVREVERKVGRNILMFQRLELLIKQVVATGKVSGYVSELEDIVASKKATVNKKTLGQLVGQFIETSNSSKSETSAELGEFEELKEPHISFDFGIIECDESSYIERNESLSKLVQERNELVHHLLLELDITSIVSCKKVEARLDEQCEKIRFEIKNVQTVAETLSRSKKILSEFLCSDEGKKVWLDLFFSQDRLVTLLAEIADQPTRNDGWTVMNKAALLLKQHAPKELALLHKGTEHKSLKALMLKSGLFEFSEEKTNKGGTRVLYKLKSGYKL